MSERYFKLIKQLTCVFTEYESSDKQNQYAQKAILKNLNEFAENLIEFELETSWNISQIGYLKSQLHKLRALLYRNVNDELRCEREQRHYGPYSKYDTIQIKSSPTATVQIATTSFENKRSMASVSDDFKSFQNIVSELKSVVGYVNKTAILNNFFKQTFTGNKYLFSKLLLSRTSDRSYRLDRPRLINLCSQIFSTSADEMTKHWDKNGNFTQMIRYYFSNSKSTIQSKKKSTLTLKDVDNFLDKLATLSKTQDQVDISSY